MSDYLDSHARAKRVIVNALSQSMYDEESEITRVQVFWIRMSGVNERIYSGKVGEEFDKEALAEQALEAATTDAEALSGIQRYMFCIFHGDDKEAKRKVRFSLFVRDQSALFEASQNAPGSAGALVEQAQRHAEVAVRQASMSLDSIVRNQAREIERLTKANEKLRDRLESVFELREQMAMMEHEKKLEELKMIANEKRKDEAMEIFKLHGPRLFGKVANKLLPANAGDSSGNASSNDFGIDDTDIASLAEMFKQLEPDQFAQMGNVLKPHQAVLVMELAKKVAAADEKKSKN